MAGLRRLQPSASRKERPFQDDLPSMVASGERGGWRPLLIGDRRGDDCGPPAVRDRYASPSPQVLASKLVFEDGLASRPLQLIELLAKRSKNELSVAIIFV